VIDRRDTLKYLAGAAVFAASSAIASEARIDKLILPAKAQGGISARIDFISRALIGTEYRGYTLIGSLKRPEKFVVRDDAFDCVTFCETVLAAAIAADPAAFDATLKTIRYRDGIVAWRERNHYFFEWGQHNIENKLCLPIVMNGAVQIEKTVDSEKGLGRRHFVMQVIPRAVFMDNVALLKAGDIVGFVTHRPNLDYFHVGFVAFDKGQFMLRHAARSRGRVLDERMSRFVAVNGVHYVTLLRPQERAVV